MAGRPRKVNQKENRGGARKGSGRKPKEIKWGSTPEAMITTAEKVAKEEKRNIDEVLLSIAYHAPLIKDRLTAIKIFKEFTMTKKHESKVDITKHQAPKVYLPEKKPDPAKVIPIGGKK